MRVEVIRDVTGECQETTSDESEVVISKSK